MIARITTVIMMLVLLAAAGQAAEYSSGIVATVLKKTTLTSNGQKIVYPRTDRAEVTAMAIDIDPGTETGWHSHPIPVYAYMVSGTLDVELQDASHIVYKAGDVIIEVMNAMHNGMNRGTEKVRLIAFYTGEEGSPTVVKPPAAAKQQTGSSPVSGR